MIQDCAEFLHGIRRHHLGFEIAILHAFLLIALSLRLIQSGSFAPSFLRFRPNLTSN